MLAFGGLLLTYFLFPVLVTSKQMVFTDPIRTIQEYPGQPIPSSEYHPVYGGSPDQDLSAESIGIEFEDGIIRSMLQIVDVKFNTLSTRMTSLERGVNSLQVYLSRQFRQVTKNLQAVNIVMNSLHAEVSHVDMETRSVRNSILALSKEFLDYRNKNLGVFRELPRVGSRTAPTEGVDGSQKNLNQSRNTDRKEINVEYKTSSKPILLSPLGNPEEMGGGFGNDSINIKDLHIHIEERFSELNETIGKRFNELQGDTGNIQETLDTVRDSMAEINNTVRKSITDQTVLKDGIIYLRGMVEYMTERQDEVLMDVTFLKEQARDNRVVPGPEADQLTRSTDEPRCPKTTSEKTGSVDMKKEFEKISDKLDIIDNRSEELNDNLVYTSDILEATRNNTAHVVKLVEALSGSTIWIPHILREVKMTARSLNESINATYLVYRQLLGRRSDTSPIDKLPGSDDSKLKKSEHYQDGARSFRCKINEEDTKLMRHQLSKVEEILQKLNNATTPKTDFKKKKTQPNPIQLLQKDVRGNTTAGLLSIQSGEDWLQVCYDESQSNLVANIACNQLEFSNGTPLIVPNIQQSTVKVFLINCLRKHPNLDYCSYRTVSADHCKDQGFLGVLCIS